MRREQTRLQLRIAFYTIPNPNLSCTKIQVEVSGFDVDAAAIAVVVALTTYVSWLLHPKQWNFFSSIRVVLAVKEQSESFLKKWVQSGKMRNRIKAR